MCVIQVVSALLKLYKDYPDAYHNVAVCSSFPKVLFEARNVSVDKVEHFLLRR